MSVARSNFRAILINLRLSGSKRGSLVAQFTEKFGAGFVKSNDFAGERRINTVLFDGNLLKFVEIRWKFVEIRWKLMEIQLKFDGKLVKIRAIRGKISLYEKNLWKHN